MQDHSSESQRVVIIPPRKSNLWRRLCSTVAITVSLAVSAPVLAETRDRVALVIGNSEYTDLPPLINPYNDAKGMAAALWEAGFETIEVLDADRQEMIAAIATFAKRIEEGTDAVFFYAGHGVQNGGKNFLLPVSTQVADVNDLSKHGVDANEVVSLMASSEARINVVILDACRDNPFLDAEPGLAQEIAQIDPDLIQSSPGTDVVVRSSAGLAPISTGRAETVVGYATAPGEVALDGENGNSPYTWALLQHLDTPGLEIGTLFRRVRAEVRKITSGQQIPWLASTLESDFYFRPVTFDAASTLDEALGYRDDDTRKLGLAPPSQLVEQAFWRVVSTSGSQADIEAYLARYPNGLFVAEAKELIEAFKSGGGSRDDLEVVMDGEGAQIAYLGVGPVPLALPDDLELPQEMLGMRVAAVPSSGMFFRRDQTRVMPEHLLATVDLDGLNFLPRVGTKNTGVKEALTLQPLATTRSLADPWDHWVRTEIHPCDLLAGFRHAPDRVWDGVQQAILNLDPEPAISACSLAVEAFPDVVRFKALLSRTHRAAGNWEEAERWALAAAEEGYAPGMSQLGTIYMRGHLGTPDYETARKYHDAAYELGNPAAALRIGEMYENGMGQEADPAIAAEWYRKSIELGNAYAATRLARLYEDGRGVPRDIDKAIEYYQTAADGGELTAQLRLARRLMEDPDTRDQALELLQAAAGTGMPEGQKALAQFYASESAEVTDLQQAVYWFDKAIDNGERWAPLYLGELYLEHAELGVAPAEAVGLISMSLDRGNASAARTLAKLYASDTLGAPDQARALRYHQIAAEAGDPWSMRDLARGLLRGEGIEADPHAGIMWMSESADAGNPWAQRDIGTSYVRGQVVERDVERGIEFLARAMTSGDEGAIKSANDRMEKFTTPEERVWVTQIWLAKLGYDVGEADGMAGPKTEAALAELSRSLNVPGLPATGSPALLSRLSVLLHAPAFVPSAPALEGEVDL